MPIHASPQIENYIDNIIKRYPKIVFIFPGRLKKEINNIEINGISIQIIIYKKYSASPLFLGYREFKQINEELSDAHHESIDIYFHWVSTLAIWPARILSRFATVNVTLHDHPIDMIMALKHKYLLSILGYLKIFYLRRKVYVESVNFELTKSPLSKFIKIKFFPYQIPYDLTEFQAKIPDKSTATYILIFCPKNCNFKGFKFIKNNLKFFNSLEHRVIIIGSSSESILRNNSNLYENIEFIESLQYKQCLDYIHNSFCILHLSLYESLPGPIVEARAFGIDVITPAYETIQHLYRNDNRIFYLHNPRSVYDIKKNLKSIDAPNRSRAYIPVTMR